MKQSINNQENFITSKTNYTKKNLFIFTLLCLMVFTTITVVSATTSKSNNLLTSIIPLDTTEDSNNTHTISNNTATSGGAIYNEGTVNINTDVTVDSNIADGGGAIYNTSSGTVTMNAGIISNNSATGEGAGIYTAGTLTMNAGTITNNGVVSSTTDPDTGETTTVTVANGGGILVHTDATATINGGEISYNTANNGGGICTRGNLNITSADVQVVHNNGVSNGGGVYVAEQGIGTIDDITLSYNTSQNGGGAYVSSNDTNIGTLTMSQGKLSYNESAQGAAIYNKGKLDCSNIEVFSNTATNYTAGIVNSGINVDTLLTNANIHDNYASFATAIANEGGGKVEINDSFIHNNTSDDTSPGCQFQDGYVVINNSEIYSNYNTLTDASNGYGTAGGIWSKYGTLDINDSLIYNNGNEYANGGAIYGSAYGTINITNTSIYDNKARFGGAIRLYGTDSESVFNLNITECEFYQNEGYQGSTLNTGEFTNVNLTLTNLYENYATMGGTLLVGTGSEVNTEQCNIYENEAAQAAAGVWLLGTYIDNNSTISGNKAQLFSGGIHINPNASATLNNTTVTNNIAAENSGEGIRINGTGGTLNIEGSTQITDDNDIYLYAGTFITVTGNLTNDQVARITPNEYTKGRTVVRNAYTEGTSPVSSENASKFTLTPQDPYFLESGDLIVDSEGILDTDLVIWELGEKYIYIDGVNGSDSNNGLTPETPVKTFKQAYSNMGKYYGAIYVVDTVTVDKDITLDKTYYKDSTSEVNLFEGSTVEIRRYSQPTVVNDGFDVESNTNNLMLISEDNIVTLNNITIDGHRNALESENENIAAPGITGNSMLNITKGSLIVDGATLQNNNATEFNGGAIQVIGSLSYAQMKSGLIDNNTADDGGAVEIRSGATFDFDGGIISNNSAENGGAICVANDSTFNMNGGKVTLNSATDGGAIHNNGTFNFNKGILDYNNATYGAAIYNCKTLEINDETVLDNNVATDSGGAIWNLTNSTANIEYATLTNNNGTNGGGAIANSGQVNVTNSILNNNNAKFGGALYSHNSAIFNISSCDITNNGSITSGAMGGALYTLNSTETNIIDCNINNNYVTVGSAGGGALYIGKSANAKINTCVLDSNTSNFDGGAILLGSPEYVLIENTEITNNTCVSRIGGAIGCLIGTTETVVDITDSEITNNKALQAGAIGTQTTYTFNVINTNISNNESSNAVGAIINYGTFNLNGCVIDSNKTTSRMAGAIVNNGGNLNIEETNITNNSCITDGGALYNIAGTVTFVSGNISNNTAPGNGGGIYNTGTLKLLGGTITGNKAIDGAGIFNSESGSIIMVKSEDAETQINN